MARKKEIVQPPAVMPEFLPGKAAELVLNQDEFALVTAQHDSAVRAVALQMGYQLPADCTDPDLIQRDITVNLHRSVQSVLEAGKGLRVLKMACAHGNFIARLDVMNVDRHVAARFMQAAVKFSNVPSTATLKAIGNQTKLFEMLVLDDEQIEELELTGQTGELKLDDVATMSVKELRHAVREARLEAETTEKRVADLHAKNDKLEHKLHKRVVAVTDWPAEFQGLMDQVQYAHKTIKHNIGALDILREKAMAIEPANPEEEASLTRAREVLAEELLSIHRRCAEYLDAMGNSFDKTLGSFAREGLYQQRAQ